MVPLGAEVNAHVIGLDPTILAKGIREAEAIKPLLLVFVHLIT